MQTIYLIYFVSIYSHKSRLSIGFAGEYLKLFHYLFMDYSPLLASEIVERHGLELRSKSDKLFIDGIYKLCRDMFTYVPKLRREQFFQLSYAVAKACMAAEIIELVKQHLMKNTKATQSHLSSVPLETASKSTFYS